MVDLLEIPEDVRSQLKIHLVDNVNEVIEIALGLHDAFALLALPPSTYQGLGVAGSGPVVSCNAG